ncbi:MAG: hypothetical protein KatS3mg038_1321 [Candidatus Kapaibacterium sp.]|nr:MAG: hypothetical protein KatS3mg038_1321 [Candidatus Kapabacteria bacterium]
MKIAVLRPAAVGWLFASGSESSFCLRLNRPNYAWWRRLVVEAREAYADGLVAAINATAALYDHSGWQPLMPGVELCHGIGRTLWDGANLIRISGGGREERAPWQPGEPAPPGSGVIYWSELLEMWRAIYLRLAEELSCERYGPTWPERVPQLVTLRATIEQEAAL